MVFGKRASRSVPTFNGIRVGSLVAGGTSEGGAAVAFPVMTLLFHISPVVAR